VPSASLGWAPSASLGAPDPYGFGAAETRRRLGRSPNATGCAQRSPLGVESIEILGCRVDAIDRPGAAARVAELANGRVPALVVTLGVEMAMRARRDPVFRAIVNGAALSLCDTIGLLLASRARKGPLRSRVTGVELVTDLVARSARERDVRLYFLGGSGDTAARAAHALEQRFPGAAVCGARDGFFPEAESDAVARTVAASGANVLLLGLGSPKQERWFIEHGALTGCGAGIGVGGSFDVFAGTVRRAPRVVQKMGLEWAYRLVREPRRWRRQLALPQFVVAVAQDMVAGRR
jgi:N-acetylglucosaminyldiphosphoundecaprenol N-acetyl-beta-D-mannosaminyltransferase